MHPATDGESMPGGSRKVAEASSTNIVTQINDLEGEGILEKLGVWLHKLLLILICQGAKWASPARWQWGISRTNMVTG